MPHGVEGRNDVEVHDRDVVPCSQGGLNAVNQTVELVDCGVIPAKTSLKSVKE